LFLAGGLFYLNGAIFHIWAADVGPRVYQEIHHEISLRRLAISIGFFILSGLALWLLSPDKKLDS
jgi:hypothetical protein